MMVIPVWAILFVVFFLLVQFQLKHFFADYPLQRPWMLGKFREKGWVLPLAAHSGVHAILTIGIGWATGWVPWTWLIVCGVFDFVMHFTMDRIKASPRWLGRFKPLNADAFVAMSAAAAGNPIGAPYPVDVAKERLRSNRWFWHSIGIDQMVHHLTHYAIILIYVILFLQ